MKEVIVKNEFDRSYLLIEADTQEESYVFKMLTQNTIPGLLECRTRYIEDTAYYAYDVTSKKSLEKEYIDKKMNFSDLVELFYGLNMIMRNANEFLLNHEGFWLQPQYIFKDLETEEMSCLYFPDCGQEDASKESGKEKYRQLADFLLDKIEHKDEHAVNIAYHFYKISKEEYFSFETFVSFMEKEALLVQAEKRRKEEKDRAEEAYSNLPRQIPAEMETEVTYTVQENEKNIRQPDWRLSGILFLLGAVLTGVYLLVPGMQAYALYILLPGLTIIVTAVLSMIRNIFLIYKENREAAYTEPAEPVRVEEYFDDMLDDVTVFFDQEEYYCLKWKEGRFSKEYVMSEFPVTVGKLKESVQMVINDSSVSRLHARFRQQGNAVYLQDLDSTNGTIVNGKRLMTGEEAIIKRGDEIQFGKIIVNVV